MDARRLDADTVLRLWEAGTGSSRTQRALLLVAAAVPEVEPPTLPQMPIGWCVARLIELLAELSGPQLACTAVCASCSEIVEVHLDLDAIMHPEDKVQSNGPADGLLIEEDDYQLVVRRLTHGDLIATENSAAEPAPALALRAICAAHHADAEISPADLPAEIWRLVEERLAAADPQADLRLEITCPHCRQHWMEPLDIVSLLWSEIAALAKSLVLDVAVIAHNFGWSEAAILGLSSARRRAYLDLALR